ncbi:amidase signature domain-containing protein [Lophiotrema nucula]|uniref:Amidase signature domain-containing protein n=1 Tax=Lophiotrema nucula TaxID=690887 RepID=A0A6A5YVF7_9PLEO|nr:amidase signature domain-containing protein [Lophiotrema nucula]
MTTQKLDVLRATAGEIRGLLDAGNTTSVELVKTYLAQIGIHNHAGARLNAVISTAPEELLLEQAQALDMERQQSQSRSRIHGIPILVKDQFCMPSFGLPTTAGTLGLKGLKTKNDAAIPTLLKKAGALIIATTNLSELGNAKGYNITAGWSPIGGQTQTPYVKGGVEEDALWLGHSTPAGSSSGSAVGVAAGFAPLSIGTELDGSIVQPALRVGLYSLKPTPLSHDLRGSQAEGSLNTRVSPLARTAKDVADLTAVLLGRQDYDSSLTGTWDGIRIAYLNADKWHYPEGISESNEKFDTQSKEETRIALAKAESLGAKVVYDAPLPLLSEMEKDHGAPPLGDISLFEVRLTLEKFFANFEPQPFHTLEEFVQFNEAHASEELPGDFNQMHLERAVKHNMTQKEYERDQNLLKEKTREIIDKCLSDTGSDVIMASGESLLTSVAMAAAYPIGSVPLGWAKFNGRGFGLEVMARNGEEDKILRVMSAWERMLPEAVKPPALLEPSASLDFHAEL